MGSIACTPTHVAEKNLREDVYKGHDTNMVFVQLAQDLTPYVEGDIRLGWWRMLRCEALKDRLFQRIMKNKTYTYEVAMNCKTFARHMATFLCFLHDSDQSSAFSLHLCSVVSESFCHYVRRQHEFAFDTRVVYYKKEQEIGTIRARFTITLID